jgi:hypothetical protein
MVQAVAWRVAAWCGRAAQAVDDREPDVVVGTTLQSSQTSMSRHGMTSLVLTEQALRPLCPGGECGRRVLDLSRFPWRVDGGPIELSSTDSQPTSFPQARARAPEPSRCCNRSVCRLLSGHRRSERPQQGLAASPADRPRAVAPRRAVRPASETDTSRIERGTASVATPPTSPDQVDSAEATVSTSSASPINTVAPEGSSP